jgi:hypothetical protein
MSECAFPERFDTRISTRRNDCCYVISRKCPQDIECYAVLPVVRVITYLESVSFIRCNIVFIKCNKGSIIYVMCGAIYTGYKSVEALLPEL